MHAFSIPYPLPQLPNVRAAPTCPTCALPQIGNISIDMAGGDEDELHSQVPAKPAASVRLGYDATSARDWCVELRKGLRAAYDETPSSGVSWSAWHALCMLGGTLCWCAGSGGVSVACTAPAPALRQGCEVATPAVLTHV